MQECVEFRSTHPSLSFFLFSHYLRQKNSRSICTALQSYRESLQILPRCLHLPHNQYRRYHRYNVGMSQGYAYNPNAFNFQPGGLFDYPDAMIRGNGHDGEPAYGHQEGAGHTPYRHRYGQDQDQPLMRPFDPSPLLQLQQRFDYHHKPQQQQHLEDHLLDSSDLHSNLAFAPPPHLAPQRFCPQDSFQSFTQENSLFLHSQHKPKRTSPPIFFSPPTPEDDMRASGNHFWGGKAPVETPYNQLLFDCLVTAPNFEMTLQDIYRWFVRTHPARFQLSEKGWQNSIRHNLSMNDVST